MVRSQSFAARAGGFLRWWFAGLSDRRTWFPGVRLFAVGVLIGMMVGWSYGKLFHVVLVEETSLPKPVTNPPPGTTWVKVLTTGYCPCPLCCGLFANGHTAINRDVRNFPFGIAAAPTLVPYRLTLEVPGYGIALVDDTGGAEPPDALHNVGALHPRFPTPAQARP